MVPKDCRGFSESAPAQINGVSKPALESDPVLFAPPTFITRVFGMNTSLPFTDMGTALLRATVLMIGSAIVVYLRIRRLGIFKF
jgi:zinc transporter